jgi:hypothetical protein
LRKENTKAPEKAAAASRMEVTKRDLISLRACFVAVSDITLARLLFGIARSDETLECLLWFGQQL